jgi:hypothetical protein
VGDFSDLWFRLFRTKVTGRPVARMAAFTCRRTSDRLRGGPGTSGGARRDAAGGGKGALDAQRGDGGQVVVLLVTRLEVPSDTETSCARPYSLVRRGGCRRPEDVAAGRRDQTRGDGFLALWERRDRIDRSGRERL